MVEQEQYINDFYNYFRGLSYNVNDNQPLICDDNTVLFVNSTIIFSKDRIENNDIIPNVAHMQDCFRAKKYDDSLIYFKMIGTIGMENNKEAMFQDFMYYLTNVCGIPQNDIFGVCSEKDKELQSLWRTAGNSSNLHLVPQKTNKFNVVWEYGKDYNFRGNGLTIVINNPNIDNCSSNCSIDCNCSKYKKIGDAVIIEKREHVEGIDNRYFDIGFGFERIIAYRHLNNEFRINYYDNIIKGIIHLGFDYQVAKKIFNINRAVNRVFNEHILPSNNKQGYVMKRLIRELFVLVATKNNWRSFDSYNEYRKIIDIVSRYEKVNNEYKQMMIDEFKKYFDRLNKGLAEAQKFIKNKGRIDEKLYSMLHSTFGLPREFLDFAWENKQEFSKESYFEF